MQGATEPDRVETIARFFTPQRVAVVGASADRSRIGGRVLRYLSEGGFAGEVLPINNRHETVQGLAAYPSLGDLPVGPDLALLCVPASDVLDVIVQASAVGVGAAVVLAGGFAEMGPAGIAAQEELAQVARESGIRLLGPNCLGVMNSRIGFYGTFSTALDRELPQPGPVAICSQSGAYGSHLLYLAHRRGLGVSYWITTGNESDVDIADAIAWVAQQEDVRVIAVYTEGVRDGERFKAALQLAHDSGTAVVVEKVGVSEAGARAAHSHTAALAGSDAAYDAVFEHYGALRANSTEALLDIAYLCSRVRPPQGNRLGVVTVSGGAGVQTCDRAEREGLEITPLNGRDQARLKELLPYAGVENPIDVTAQAVQNMEILAKSLKVVVESGDFDCLLAFFTHVPMFSALTEKLRTTIVEGARSRGEIPMVLCVLAERAEVLEYEKEGFAVFEDLDRSVAALAALSRLGRQRSRPERAEVNVQVPQAVLPDRPLSEAESREILRGAGLSVLPERVATSADAAAAAAAEFGYPVALKVVSADLAHKSEVGGVELDVGTEGDLRTAYERIVTQVKAAAPDVEIDGLMVSPMAEKGVEVIVGSHLDPTFGQLVLFGLGGIFAEVLGDVALRVAPVSVDEAHAMTREIRGFPLLDGARGRARSDVGALAEAISLVSHFAARHGQALTSLDINPLIVLPDGEGVVAVDAMIAARQPK